MTAYEFKSGEFFGLLHLLNFQLVNMVGGGGSSSSKVSKLARAVLGNRNSGMCIFVAFLFSSTHDFEK